jgi:hypothetical protein
VGVAAGGLFCELAALSGATDVVGITDDADLIQKTKQRVPVADVRLVDWNQPTVIREEGFDVVCVSEDFFGRFEPKTLIHFLMTLVAADGLLVFDWPMFEEDGPEFKAVHDSDDAKLVAGQFSAVRSLCREEDWSYRRVGLSNRERFGLKYHVHQVGFGRKNFFLLHGESTSGKSTLATFLSDIPSVVKISGDSILWEIFSGKRESSAQLFELVKDSQLGLPYPDWSAAYRAINRHGMEGDFISAALEGVPDDASPVLDAYFPEVGRDSIAQAVRDLGFNAVELVWQHPVPLTDEETHLHQLSLLSHRFPVNPKQSVMRRLLFRKMLQTLLGYCAGLIRVLRREK